MLEVSGSVEVLPAPETPREDTSEAVPPEAWGVFLEALFKVCSCNNSRLSSWRFVNLPKSCCTIFRDQKPLGEFPKWWFRNFLLFDGLKSGLGIMAFGQ